MGWNHRCWWIVCAFEVLLVVGSVGCSSDESSKFETREEAGLAIIENANADSELPTSDFSDLDPVWAAERGAELCAGLKVSEADARAAYVDEAQERMTAHLRLDMFPEASGDPEIEQRRSGVAASAADGLGDTLANATVDTMCPDLGAGEFLPSE